MASPIREEADTLFSLEERILRAVELVNSLREEKNALETKLQSVLAAQEEHTRSTADLRAENDKLAEELETLRAERKQVRGRIEKLLGQLDSIAS